MKQGYLLWLILGVVLSLSKPADAQIETKLATHCAIGNIEVPINIKNLENIKAFELKLLFNNAILHLDTSLYHYPEFELGNQSDFGIKVSASNDTISVAWASYDPVSVEDDLLLSLIFNETGSGEATFSWIEDECFYTDVTGLDIDANYIIDGSITLPFNSSIDISFEQFNIGCRDNSESGGCKAQAEVNILGGQRPYEYHWHDKFNQRDSLAIGLCQDPVLVSIRDASGCIYSAFFDAVIYPAAKYSIVVNPDMVFITKPVVDLSIETEDSYIETYEWDFGDDSGATTETVSHAYGDVGFYNISLKTENLDGCDTTVYFNNFEVRELNFCIPNVFTPNGDGINDTWIFNILGEGSSAKSTDETGFQEVEKCSGDDLIFADHFKSSTLVVINRRGNKVYECTNCTEYWDGSGLPDGVYFYVFTWEGEYSKGKEQGSVTIIGSNN